MNALEIVLSPKGPATLPMAYQQFIQGALYGAWGETVPELHDEGYSDGGRTFRMFCFSGLEGRYRASGSEITFSGPLRLEVRSPVPALLEPLADAFSKERELRLGTALLPISGLYCRDRLDFPARALIEMRTPLSLHRTLPDGSKRYYAPQEEDFCLLLAENLSSKLAAARLPLDPCIALTPLEGTLKKRVTAFKSSYISGWTGRFLLEAEPETLSFLYYAGLGASNPKGFGMFDILRPLD